MSSAPACRRASGCRGRWRGASLGVACSLAALALATFAAQAGAETRPPPAKRTPLVVRMDYVGDQELIARDGSRFEATLGVPPAIVDGAVVAAAPWPNRVDVERYASKTGDSRFHFESTAEGRRVVQIDVAVARWPREGSHVVRFFYGNAGELLEVVRTYAAAAGREATHDRKCFVHDGQGRLIGYASNAIAGIACKDLQSNQLDRQFVRRADGSLERAIERGFTLSLDGRAGRPTRVSVYGAAGEVVARLEDDGGAAVRLPAEIKDDAIHQGYGVVTADGEVLLRDPRPANDDAWKVVRTPAPEASSGNLFGDVLNPESILATGVGKVRLGEAQRTELAREARDQPERIFLHWRIRAKALYPALDDGQWASCIDPTRHGPAACGA